MDGYEYKLKEQTASKISNVASCIDDLRSDLNLNSRVNSKRIDDGLSNVCSFIEALTSQVSALNKTMQSISNSLSNKQ